MFDLCGRIIFFSTVEVGMIYFVGLCRPYVLCNSQNDFHHRGHIGHFIFLSGGIGLSSGHLNV
jgi:hypothetical protein